MTVDAMGASFSISSSSSSGSHCGAAHNSPLPSLDQPFLVPSPLMPGRRGILLGPGTATGPYFRVRLSAVDEHLFSRGAAPSSGPSLCAQLRRGPCCWSMFVSCAGFAIPGLLHLYKHESWADWIAGAALLCVSVTSSLCDAFCVDSGVYDDGEVEDASSGPGVVPYVKTAAAVGMQPDEVQITIQNSGALREVLANDGWNNATRLLDRATCVFFAAPAAAGFALSQRPDAWGINLVLAGGFVLAWTFCFVGQRYRNRDPCGIRYLGGRYAVERNYAIHQRLHKLWHLILIVTLSASALYRPQDPAASAAT